MSVLLISGTNAPRFRSHWWLVAVFVLFFVSPIEAQEEQAPTPTPTVDEATGEVDYGVYDAEEMAAARRQQIEEHGGSQTFMIFGDRFEFQNGDDEDLALFEIQGWWGGDMHRLWIKTEGEVVLNGTDEGDFEEAELQVLYSHPISPYFDINAGIRHDFEPQPDRTFAVIGIQGLAPYWFEIDAALFLSEDGDVSARFEAEYEMLFTQRLIGQARLELNAGAQEVPELGLGSGLNALELGYRVRYEIRREFGPYLGLTWTRQFAGTADFTRAGGGDPESTALVAGLRFWY